MPKAVKDRPKHRASLTAQLQNDRDPLVADSKWAKRKRKADEEALQDKDDVISGKQGQQIIAMAREQQHEA
jgi:hypothetical protein